MRGSGLIVFALVVFALALIVMPAATAANPIDMAAAPLQEKLNATASDLGKSAIEHIAQGNLTQEHISQDINNTINTTKDQLKKAAMEQIDQELNATADQIGQKIKVDLKNQVNKKVQEPGFEALFAILSLLSTASIIILRRRN